MSLEKLIEQLCDTSDLTDAEVREELAADGIDVDAAKARTMAKVDALLAARAVRLAIAAVKANPPHPESPMPWGGENGHVSAIDGSTVADTFYRIDAAHIAAAVNAAPLLIAEVKRLQAVVEAARVAVERLVMASCHAELCDVQFGSPDDCECSCGLGIARIEARRALGLEV